MSIYENVVEAAGKNEITLTALEDKAGIAHGIIGKWKNAEPNIATLRKVAEALDVSVTKLIGEE